MEDQKTHRIWKPIELTDEWLNCDTSTLDDILDSWYERREVLQKNSQEYSEFINELKREHAIETGVIERLYELDRGVTETLIKKGFLDTYVEHDSTDIPVDKLMAHLGDHMEAVDFVFDVVKENRDLTIGFIHQLHALVTRNQDYAEGRDQFGNRTHIELIRGKFKVRENNPTRPNGTIVMYCPPEQVASEMENLVGQYREAVKTDINPIIITAWIHHAFTTIHPYQDGNGRVARLLTSLILIKNGLFPFTVQREEAKDEYIGSLESADGGDPQPLVSYICDTQRRHIEKALNLKEVSSDSLDEVTRIFSSKFETWHSVQRQEREEVLTEARGQVFDVCLNAVHSEIDRIKPSLPSSINIDVKLCSPSDKEEQHFYYGQIIKYAKKHDYFFNRNLPKGWIMVSIFLGSEKVYRLGISIHHYGYDDNTLAIGAFLEDAGHGPDHGDRMDATLPLEIKPLVISATGRISSKEPSIKRFVNNALTVSLAHIANELG